MYCLPLTYTNPKPNPKPLSFADIFRCQRRHRRAFLQAVLVLWHVHVVSNRGGCVGNGEQNSIAVIVIGWAFVASFLERHAVHPLCRRSLVSPLCCLRFLRHVCTASSMTPNRWVFLRNPRYGNTSSTQTSTLLMYRQEVSATRVSRARRSPLLRQP